MKGCPPKTNVIYYVDHSPFVQQVTPKEFLTQAMAIHSADAGKAISRFSATEQCK